VIGAGGLGGPLLLYLTAAGVGQIDCIENDVVDITNLQRQILFSTDDIGKSKSAAAENRLVSLNPHVQLRFIEKRLTALNATSLIQGYDLVIDGSDNFPTRFIVNDCCMLQSIPLISGGILRFYGMLLGVMPGKTPCYRCVFEHHPPEGTVPSCSAAGVLGATAGTIGSLMAAEALKFLAGIEKTIMGRLLRIDLLSMDYRLTDLPENPNCPCCQSYRDKTLSFNPENPDYTAPIALGMFSVKNLQRCRKS